MKAAATVIVQAEQLPSLNSQSQQGPCPFEATLRPGQQAQNTCRVNSQACWSLRLPPQAEDGYLGLWGRGEREVDGFQLGNRLFHEGGGGVNVAMGRECFGLLCVLSQDE